MMMSEPRRQHPVAAITNVLRILREMLIPIIIILVVGGGGDRPLIANLTGLGLIVFVLLIWGILSWMFYTYRIEEDELRIEYGIFVKKKLYIPRHRIQVIDVTAGPIQRLFGLVSLKVQTAGESKPEGEISAVTREVAEQVREELMPEETTEPLAEAIDSPSSVQKNNILSSRRISRGHLLIAASTSGSFGVVLSILGTIFAQADHVFSESEVEAFVEQAAQSGTQVLIYAAIIMVILAWLLALLGTLIRFAGFTINKKKDELVIQRGLFERKTMTIPYKRIQAVRIVEGILRQPFGYATLYVESAGYGDEGGQSTVLFPLIHRSKISEFIEEMVPEYYDSPELLKPPPRAITRYMIKTALPVLIIAGILTLAATQGYYALFLALPALLWGILRFRDARIGTTDNTLLMRFRRLARTTAIIKKYRIQSADSTSSFIQRRRDLISVSTTIASGSSGSSFTVDELDDSYHNQFISWLAENRS